MLHARLQKQPFLSFVLFLLSLLFPFLAVCYFLIPILRKGGCFDTFFVHLCFQSIEYSFRTDGVVCIFPSHLISVCIVGKGSLFIVIRLGK